MTINASQWYSSGCGGSKARWIERGRIEIEGDGVVSKPVPEAVKKWAPDIIASAKAEKLWPSFVAGFMSTESGGNQFAKSFCCYGLMGFLPATASWVAGRKITPDDLLYNPKLNIQLGAKLIATLMDKYSNNMIKVAASYNAGSVKCGAPKKCPDAPNRWNVVSDCAQGKAVDYPGRIIAYTNGAAESGLFGHSSAERLDSNLKQLAAGIAIITGVLWWRSRR